MRLWAWFVLLMVTDVGGQTKLVPHAEKLVPQALRLGDGRTMTLNLPPEFAVGVAAEGMRRVRFLAKAPDGRVFATDMDSMADNTRGKVYVLEGWDEGAHRFARRTTYLSGLRNPNNVAFWTDAGGQSWMYVALTDRLMRYRYRAGSVKPDGEPEVLARYPDYGLNYKYGGWHLTRTVAVAALRGRAMLYVTVGSSCNACREKEEIRATASIMEMDGTKARVIGQGLRNGVGMVAVPSSAEFPGGALLGTNMGADHLGDGEPEDTFFELDSARMDAVEVRQYGWPTCYFAGGMARADRLVSSPLPGDHIFPPPPAGPAPAQMDCRKVALAYTTFQAHSSPLGVAWFGDEPGELKESFLVALHGAGHPRVGTGYRVVRFSPGQRVPEDFITGFLSDGKVVGRPCGILATGLDSFLLTDDKNGVVFAVYRR